MTLRPLKLIDSALLTTAIAIASGCSADSKRATI